MPPKVTADFRAQDLKPESRKYLTEITAQQCAISEIYWNTKCELKDKK